MAHRFNTPFKNMDRLFSRFKALPLGTGAPPDNTHLFRISPHTSGRLRRSTLITLRWTAVMGQALSFILIKWGLGYDLPVWFGLGVISLSVILNIALTLSLPLDRRVSDAEAVCQLGYDVIHLSVLLWLTGGMVNPFALLFLAPVVTAATTLNWKVFTTLSGLTIAASLALLFYHRPLPWHIESGFDLPEIYTFGGWIALMVGIGFSSLYTWGAALETRRMSEALASTQAVLADEQKLAALGSLAAAAAHELGTPLATIQITAKEMLREIPPKSPLAEDAALLHSQAERCRDILHQLSSRGDEKDPVHNSLSFEDLISEAASPYFSESGPVKIDIHIDGHEPSPRLARQAELIFSLKNFIENAMDFAHSMVKIETTWDSDQIKIIISDDGPGFDPRVRDRLGEPYISGRLKDSKAGGLGLGVFIAKTLIERTGGRVTFGRDKSIGGAVIILNWPRKRLDISQTHEALPP